MATLFVFASSYGGFAALSLSMSRYRQHVWRRAPASGTRFALRGLGSLGLALALWASVAQCRWALGLVWWAAALTVTSLALALAITYQPRRVPFSAALAWLLAGAAAALL